MRFGDAFYLSEDAVLPADVRMPKARPRSATFIGTLWWPWSPAGSRVEDVYDSLDSSRKYMVLWSDSDDGEFSLKRAPAIILRHLIDPELAVLALLLAGYRGEEMEFGSETGPWIVWRPDFFSAAELMMAAAIIWPDEKCAGGA